MALFDKDNPGKNLTNATIWLDSSQDSDDGGSNDSDDSGCSFRTVVIALGILVVLGNVFASCVAHACCL